jgi:kynureninase
MTNSKTVSDRVDLDFIPTVGAGGYQLSNPSVLDMMALRASLEVFDKTTMTSLRRKSVALAGYLEYVLQPLIDRGYFAVITPRLPEERGAQLSLFFATGMQEVFTRLKRKGIMCDDRKPNVIRIAPTALYNTFEEIWEFVIALREILAEMRNEGNGHERLDISTYDQFIT